MGGIHLPSSKTIYLDTLQDANGNDIELEFGVNYQMDIFHAERCPGGSNFTIKTNVRTCIETLIKDNN